MNEGLWYGLQIVTDQLLTESYWEFPKDRFVSYYKEDEWWAIKYGFGKWSTRASNTIYRIGDKLVMHPDIFELIKKGIMKI